MATIDLTLEQLREAIVQLPKPQRRKLLAELERAPTINQPACSGYCPNYRRWESLTSFGSRGRYSASWVNSSCGVTIANTNFRRWTVVISSRSRSLVIKYWAFPTAAVARNRLSSGSRLVVKRGPSLTVVTVLRCRKRSAKR